MIFFAPWLWFNFLSRLTEQTWTGSSDSTPKGPAPGGQ